MKYKDRAIRVAVALAVAGLIASQIPMRGETALGSVPQPGGPPGPTDGYFLSTDGDHSGSFLGIRGLTNRNAITGIAVTLVGLGAYSTVLDSRSVGSTGGDAIEGGRPLKNLIAGGDSTKPIYDVATGATGDFSELVKLIDDADMTTTLRAEGPYTFFAPTNMGLTLMKPDDLSRLRKPENKTRLTRFIQLHTVKGRYKINDLLALKNGTRLETLSGQTVTIRNENGFLTINNIAIIQNDMAASNGWIHPIEAPLELP